MNYIMIIAALLILVVLIGMEIKRPARSFLWLRIIATIVSIASVLFLVIPLPFSSFKKTENEIIVLSEGYSKDSVAQFLKSANQSLQQYQLSDISPKQMNGISKIHLFGNGFKDTSQVSLPNIPIIFHPTFLQTGIQNIHWKENIVSGSALLVQGTCVNLSNKKARLVLYGWDQSVDSIAIEAGKQQNFSFTVVPKNEGRGIYHLALIAGKDSLEKEGIAYEVSPAKPLKVLILSESPDFETKFLKNWLADFGYTVVSKTSVSKEKYQKTFSNTTPLNFEKITAPVLEEQDLIVSDDATLQTLSATELALLQKAISEKGVGLILNADSVLTKKNFVHDFVTVKTADSNKVTINISRLGERKSASPLQFKHPYQIIEKEGTHPLFIDQQKRVFAVELAYGKGKLIINTLQKTSSWLLSGNKIDYRNYWVSLINQSAKKELVAEIGKIKTELPGIGEAISIEAQTNGSHPPQLLIGQQELSLKQNALMPSFWEATYWPLKAGWHRLIGTKNELKDWYVYPIDSWKTVYAAKQISQTKTYLENRTLNGAKNSFDQKMNSSIPPLYLFLLFLVSMAFLWVERKFQ